MLFKGILISSASGRIGDAVASRNSGGSYFRSIGNPNPNPATDEQLTCRQALADLYAQWQELSDEARGKWELFSRRTLRPSRIGTYRPVGGYQEFCRANFCRFICNAALGQGLSTVVLPTNNTEADQGFPIPSFTIAESHAEGFLYYDDDAAWNQSDQSALIAWFSPVLPPTINWYRSPMTLAFCWPGTTLGGSPYTFEAPGELAAGNVVFVKTRTTMYHGGLSPEQWHRIVIE